VRSQDLHKYAFGPSLAAVGRAGAGTNNIPVAALSKRGVPVFNAPGANANAVKELVLAGMLIAARNLGPALEFTRNLPLEDLEKTVESGKKQFAGFELPGHTLGVIGLGKIGSKLARYGQALGMNVLAWSPNLTAEKAQAAGARMTDKATLLEQSDVVTLHVVLSERSRGLLGKEDLARMKPNAILVNSSRGPLVDEAALVAAVQSGRLIAALDVYGQEPLQADHPLRALPNTVLTPHLGYCTTEVYGQFYRESVENVLAYLDGKPIRVLNPDVLSKA